MWYKCNLRGLIPGIGDAERTSARSIRRKTETISGVVANFSILVYGGLRDMTEGEELSVKLSLTCFLLWRWLMKYANTYRVEWVIVRKSGMELGGERRTGIHQMMQYYISEALTKAQRIGALT